MSEDQGLREQLRDRLGEVLAAEAPLEKVLAAAAAPARADCALWPILAELGYLGAAAPEADGGMGFGPRELAGAYEALGRAVAPAPFLATTLFADALASAGSAAQRARYLPAIVAGQALAAVASPCDSRAVRLAPAGDGAVRLEGGVDHLLDGARAELLLVFAEDREGRTQALILEPGADDVKLAGRDLVDRTRDFARIDLAGVVVPAERLLPADAAALGERLLSHAAMALAFDSLGGAEHAFEITVDYLKVRTQFGRPIGAFQALKHRCADLKAELEMARALATQAADSAGSADFDRDASLAKAIVGDLYARTAGEAVQLHGGIGFTAEHPCHLFLKRAKLNQAIFGSSAFHRDRAFAQLVS